MTASTAQWRVAGIGLPVYPERGERRESSSASLAASACPGPAGYAPSLGMSGVFRRLRLPMGRRADGGPVSAANHGNATRRRDPGRVRARPLAARGLAAALLAGFAALLALALPAQGQTGVCSRTPEVRDAIVAETGAACSAVTSTQLAAITYLEITGYSSANIVPADFAGLTTLDTLTIFDSPELTTVPANAFREVTSLTGLFLENNSISSVHVDAFDGLSVLGILNIPNNYIEVLEDGVFAGMDALYRISMQYNPVSVLDEDTFAGAPNLSTIDLAFNRVSSVHRDTFAGLDDTLRDLSFQENRISSLPAGIFDGLTTLWRPEEAQLGGTVWTEHNKCPV